MNLVDSCGWLEYLADGPKAGFYGPALENVRELIVPSIVVLEVFKRVLHQRGEGAALDVAALMQQGRRVDLDASVAMAAAKIGCDLGLPLADSVILATARAHNATLWTHDAHFNGIEGVRFAS